MTTPEAERDAVETLAKKAAWVLENGATGENRDIAEGVLALRLAMVERGGWQDIETAPKDGTPVLVSIPEAILIVAEWYSIPNGAWHSAGRRLAEPTHWMPLPAPPSAGGGA